MSLSFVWEVFDHGKRPVEEATNGGRNLRAVRLQREVTRVEEADIGVGEIAVANPTVQSHDPLGRTDGCGCALPRGLPATAGNV